MTKFDYLMPMSIDEAISLCVSHGERARYIAGGTDVMVKVKEGKITPQYLVSLRHVPGLDQITHKDGELRIGALVTHRMLELSPIIKNHYPIIADSVSNIGSVQIIYCPVGKFSNLYSPSFVPATRVPAPSFEVVTSIGPVIGEPRKTFTPFRPVEPVSVVTRPAILFVPEALINTGIEVIASNKTPEESYVLICT